MKILKPITIGNIVLKNRIMFPPLTTGYEERDGSIGQQSLAFYTRLAKGGVGYIVLGDVAPIRSFSPTPKLFDDSQIPSFQALADSIHQYGTKIGVQIFHPEYDCDEINALFMQKKIEEMRARLRHDMEHFVDEVSEQTLLNIIKKMCDCAVRAKKAGIDFVQIHGDRLVGALCSTKMNHRTDKFGGSLENRTRFALMLVKALKEAVPDMPIDYKFSIVTPERGKGGIDLCDAPQFAKWLEEAGVSMLHVAQANHTGNMADTIPPMGVQPYGFFVDIAGKIKETVSIPVSTVGRIIDPVMAERILESNKADIVGLGRPLLADPDWVNKTASGNTCDIRRCISCNKGCTDNIQNRTFLSCVLNAENGYEEKRCITPADVKKNIVIVGGGCAGLEAARVAAQKGHTVTLFEKESSLGGQLTIACVPPRKEEMRRAIYNLVHAVNKEGVTLRIGETATLEKILSLSPDTVIIATGAHSFMPPIQGINNSNVCDAWEILSGKQQVYGKVAVIGGGMVGCETAEYLAERGAEVSIIEMMDTIAKGESSTILPTLMENYQKYHVAQYTGHTVKEITLTEVICETKENSHISIPCDYAVIALGAKPTVFDTSAIEEKGIPVMKIGDCNERAADISNAIRTGYDAANAL